MDLNCYYCLTDPNAMPGTEMKPASTLARGTALCVAHARESRHGSPELRDLFR